MISNYAYRNYFYDQTHKKNILIVSQHSVVTKVAGRPPSVDTTGIANPIIITNDDIYKEEFELSEALNSAENLSFGSCEAGIMKFTIRHNKQIPFTTYVDAKKQHNDILKLYFYFDDDSSTLMYYGMYMSQKDELSDAGDTRQIEAVDFIYQMRDLDIYNWYRFKFLGLNPKTDKEQDVNNDSSSNDEETIPEPKEMSVKTIRDALFKFLNGQDQEAKNAGIELDYYMPIWQQSVTLPNDDWKFRYKVTTDKLSFMQILEDICEINGRFGHIGRTLDSQDRCIFEYVELPRYDVEVNPYNYIQSHVMTKNIKHDYYVVRGIRSLQIYNAEAKEIARYEKGIPTVTDDDGNTYKDYNVYSEYIIYDNKFIDSVTVDSAEAATFTNLLKNIYSSIRYRTYTPYKVTAMADLCIELGDRIRIENDFDPYGTKNINKEKFNSYVLERTIKGIQNMTDTYAARGDRALPKFGDSSNSSSYYSYNGSGYTVSSTPGGESSGTSGDANEDNVVSNGTASPADLVEYIRNFGIRLLNEPNIEYKMTNDGPAFRWEDPADITTNRPAPATWAGTLIVRKKGSAPRNRWDFAKSSGGILVNSTTRDEYKEEYVVDDGSVLPAINPNATYYYGIFPYDTEGHCRYTKIIKADRLSGEAPTIKSVKNTDNDIVIKYTIPENNYEYVKLVYKKNNIPDSIDERLVVDLDPTSTQYSFHTKFNNGIIYFIILAKTNKGLELESNVAQTDVIETSKDPYDVFNHGDITMRDWIQLSNATRYCQRIYYWKYYNNNEYLGQTDHYEENSIIAFNTSFRKGKATKLYVEAEITNGASGHGYDHNYNLSYCCLFKTLPTSYSMPDSYAYIKFTNYTGDGHNYTNTSPWYNMPRTVCELDLTNVPDDKDLYLGFFKCDCSPKIYRIWFDDQIEMWSNHGLEFPKNINQWTKVNMSPTINFTYPTANDMTHSGGGGFERIYTPISVDKNTDYALTFEYESSTGYEGGNYGAYGVNDICVYINTSAPSSSGSEGERFGRIAKLNIDDHNIVMSAKKYTLKFNSGDYTQLYLTFDFGYVKDGVSYKFNFSEIYIDKEG